MSSLVCVIGNEGMGSPEMAQVCMLLDHYKHPDVTVEYVELGSSRALQLQTMRLPEHLGGTRRSGYPDIIILDDQGEPRWHVEVPDEEQIVKAMNLALSSAESLTLP